MLKGVRKIVVMGLLLSNLVGIPVNNVVGVDAQQYIPSRLSTGGYSRGILNNFRVDAQDPEWVDGAFINHFLEYYPNSQLRGRGGLIKYYADKYGISVVAYLGQIAKETTFGSVSCGGQYNFGCYMWASWMGVGMIGPSTGHTNYDRDWANPPTLERGIEIQMQLIRNNYINHGYVYYPVYLERYSPAFENDHSSFEALMYSVAMSFGQELVTTKTKVPGGLANNSNISEIEFGITQYDEVDKAYLTRMAQAQSKDIVSVELLADIDTSEPGVVEAMLFVEFSDGTFKDIKGIFNVEGVASESHLIDEVSNNAVEIKGKYGDDIEVDITDLGVSSGNIGILVESDPEYLVYKNSISSNKDYSVDGGKLAPITTKDGRSYITIKGYKGRNYVLVKDVKTDVDSVVDGWLDSIGG